MDFTLRDFQSNDLDVLWRIDQECFSPGVAYSRAELTAYVAALGAFTIVAETASAAFKTLRQSHNPRAESARAIAGFIVAETERKRVGHIITIDILQEARGYGIGSNLLAAAEQRLRCAQCDRVRLEAAVDNAAALRFYKRHGYLVVKTIRGYYSNGGDAFVLLKDL